MQAPFRFWMVKGEGPANVIHPERASAEREAQRLARENPGRLFYVMQAVAAHRKVDVERFDLREEAELLEQFADPEIPF